MSSSVRRSILIYGAAFAIAGLTPFLLLPVMTKQLTPEQFGEVTSFLVLTALLGSIAGLTAHGFVSVRFFKTAPEQFRTLISSSIVTISATHGLGLLVVTVLFPLLAKTLGLPLHYTMLAALAALFLNLNLVFLAIFQSSSQPWLYFKVRALQSVIDIVVCAALLFGATATSGARIYSYTIALAASAMLGLYWSIRRGYVGAHAQRTAIKSMFEFGLPMLPHIVAGSAIIYIDRLVVSSLLGAESLGIYMVAMQVGMAMVVLVEPLNKALAPWLFEHLSKDNLQVRQMVVARTYQLFAGLVLVGVLITTAAYLLFSQFIGAKFIAARELIPWMVAGFVLQGMYYAVVNYMFYAERTGILSVVSGSTAIVGGLVSYWLTLSFGLQGAAASFFVTNSLLFLLVWYAASKVVPMPWALRMKAVA